mmetsp:Transcript_2897/g.6487  ORF Transcript_2897/g.6487 Transcript_2897/m.6487 type:complete len:88 (-) Transcript_2897:20-283(-)
MIPFYLSIVLHVMMGGDGLALEGVGGRREWKRCILYQSCEGDAEEEGADAYDIRYSAGTIHRHPRKIAKGKVAGYYNVEWTNHCYRR